LQSNKSWVLTAETDNALQGALATHTYPRTFPLLYEKAKAKTKAKAKAKLTTPAPFGPRIRIGSQLADRVAALEAEKAALILAQSQTQTQTQTRNKTLRPDPNPKVATTTIPQSSDDSNTNNATTTTQLRLDLAEALRGRGQAQARLKAAETELATLRSKAKADGKRVSSLTAERAALVARVRDLNEELEKKKKFLKVCYVTWTFELLYIAEETGASSRLPCSGLVLVAVAAPTPWSRELRSVVNGDAVVLS